MTPHPDPVRASFDAIDYERGTVQERKDMIAAHAEEIAGLRASLSQVEADYLAVAQAVGIVLQGDGHNDEAGPVEAIVAEVKRRDRVAAATEAERDRLREVLAGLEWASTDYDYDERPSMCPMCRHTEPTHSATCALAAALRTTP